MDMQEFLTGARAWLDVNSVRRTALPDDSATADDSVEVFPSAEPAEERVRLEAAMAWQARKFEAGYGAISLQPAVGGLGLPHDFERAFAAIEREYDIPPANELFRVTLNLVAPTIAGYGSGSLRSTVLRELLAGSALACQLFSEPDAGSDLASLRCRARREGSEWIIDGHKVWTSGANLAEYGQLIARTDDAGSGHRGLTAFMVPLDLPGVTIRPIRQMTGGASFNEVFFDGVRVADELRLGDVGQGWPIALATLAFERETSGEHHHEVGGSIERVIDLARRLGRHLEPLVRDRVADLYVRARVLELTNQRAAARGSDGPGATGSIGKLLWTQNMAAMSDVVSMLLGPQLTADTGSWGTYAWAEHVLGAPGYRIAGGSDEIQRNIIGERVLGLPREPRPALNERAT